MNYRFLTTPGSLAVVLALIPPAMVVVAGQAPAAARRAKSPAPAKAWTAPRTAEGQPDLQGVWESNGATPLERPKALEGKERLTDDEVIELKKRAARIFDANGSSDFAAGDDVFLAALANDEQHANPNATGSPVWMVEREWDNRTSLIVDPPDGRVPALTPRAQQKRAASAAAGRRPPADPDDLSNLLRCITAGVPRLGGNAASYNSFYQILQTPGYVVLAMETIHDARIIPLDPRPHLPSTIQQWNGDSRGRWEGDTLVVDTTNFSSRSSFLGSAENLHLVERFTRVAPDAIDYQITLDDPTTWTKPWTAVVRLKQSEKMLYEYACHEGNSETMGGILGGARAEDQAAEGAPKAPR